MSVKKVATRESYGNALVEIGKNMKSYSFEADLGGATKTTIFRKEFRKDILNAVLQNVI